MSKPTIRQFEDPLHGVVTVIEGEHGTVMTNAKPDRKGRWIKEDNSYRYILTPNRAARRAK